MQADIGLIGLAVMGQNLVLNMNDHGYTVAVYNRTPAGHRCVSGGKRQRHEGHRGALAGGTGGAAETPARA